MEIEFTPDKADFRTVGQFQANRSMMLHNRIRRQRIAYGIGFSLLALGTYFTMPNTVVPYVFGVLAVISIILYPVYIGWRIRRRINRLVEERATPASLAQCKLRVTAEGLEQETEYGEGKVKWILVNEVASIPTHTFVAVEGTFAIVIPKARVSKGDYDEFIESLRRQLNEARLARAQSDRSVPQHRVMGPDGKLESIDDRPKE